MSDIINSYSTNINHPAAVMPVTMGKNKQYYIEAPQSLPRYSIDSVLKERDEFRKEVTLNQINELYPVKKPFSLKKIGFILAAIGGFLLLSSKGKK